MIRDWALMIMIVDIFDLVIRSTLEREGTARNIRIIQDIELSKISNYPRYRIIQDIELSKISNYPR